MEKYNSQENSIKTITQLTMDNGGLSLRSPLKFYTRKDIQSILSIGKTKATQLLKDGIIQSTRYGNEYRVSHVQLNEYLVSVGLVDTVKISANHTVNLPNTCYNIDSTLKSEYPNKKSHDVLFPKFREDETIMNKKKNKKRGNPFKRIGRNGAITWMFYYFEQDENGVTGKMRYKGGFRTKTEAVEAKINMEAKIANKQYVRPQTLTLKDYLIDWHERNYKKWLKYPAEQRKKSPSTIKEYDHVILKYVIPDIGNVQMQRITKTVIEDFYERLQFKWRFSVDVVHRTNKVLRKAFNDALRNRENKLMEYNPCLYIELPEKTNFEPTLFTLEELKKLVHALEGTLVELPTLISLTLGIRKGEALGTRVEDWDFERNTVYLHQQIGLVDPYAKGEKSRYGIVPHLKSSRNRKEKNRYVSAPQYLMDKVKARIAEIKEYKQNNSDYNDLGLLCCNENGDFLNPKEVYRKYKRVLEKAGLEPRRFHDLRGSQITLLYDNDVPLAEISKNAGHADERITRQIYLRSNTVGRQCSETMQNILFDNLGQ